MSNRPSVRQELDRMKLSIRGVSRDFYFRRNSSDSRVISQIFHDHSYDLGRSRRFRHLIEFLRRSRTSGKRPLIVDAGANIGASSVYFAATCPDAFVTAIEPDFGNYQLLAENSKGLGVAPVLRALAATNSRFCVMDVGEGFWGYRTRLLDDGEEGGIRSITMNQIYEMHASDCFPFIAKIDIEGGEKDLFASHVEWVSQTPLLIIELHDWLLPTAGSALPFLQCIAQLDRDFVYIGEDVYSIANDLEPFMPATRPTKAGNSNRSTSGNNVPPGDENDHLNALSAIANLEEPLDEELVAAMKDFQTNVSILRHTDDELRAALGVLEAEKAQIQEALVAERSAAQDAAHALAGTQQQLRSAQQELTALHTREQALVSQLEQAEHGLASTQQELQSAQQELTALHTREQALVRQLEQAEHGLASSQQELRSTQQELQSVQQELTGLHTRERVVVGELSLAVNSLQQLRDQLDERNQAVTATQQRLETTTQELTELRVRKKSELSSAAAARQRLKDKLRNRTQELTALRQHTLVRVILAVGNWMNRWSGRGSSRHTPANHRDSPPPPEHPN